MKIWIKNIQGQHFIVDIDQNDKVDNIKQKIIKTLKLQSDTFQIFYDGQVIDSESTANIQGMKQYQSITIIGDFKMLVPLNRNKQHRVKKQKRPTQKKVKEQQIKKQNIKIDQSIVQSLSSLGYSHKNSRQALIQADGDTAKAILILHQLPKDSQDESIKLRIKLGFQQLGLSQVLANIRQNPHLKAITILAITPMANPEFIKLLTDHPRQFDAVIHQSTDVPLGLPTMNMPSGGFPMRNMSIGGLQIGDLQRGNLINNMMARVRTTNMDMANMPFNIPQMGMLTLQDRQAISRIVQLGFNEAKATSAYLEAGRSYQQAVNLLIDNQQQEDTENNLQIIEQS